MKRDVLWPLAVCPDTSIARLPSATLHHDGSPASPACVLWQVFPGADLADVLLPAGQRLVHNLQGRGQERKGGA